MKDKFFTTVEDFANSVDKGQTKEAREVLANAGLNALRAILKKPYMAALAGGALTGAAAGAGAGYLASEQQPASAEEPYGAAVGGQGAWLAPTLLGGAGLLGGLLGGFAQPLGQAAAKKLMAPAAGDEILLEKLRVDDP